MSLGAGATYYRSRTRSLMTVERPKSRAAKLALLVAVEFWERYSFYGLRVLLVLFLTGAPSALGLGWSPARAIMLFAIYACLSYLLPVVGGWIADQYWGARRCVLLGGWIIVAGHLTLSVPLLFPSTILQPSIGSAGKDLLS